MATLRKRMIPIMLALVVFFVLMMLLDPGLREKVKAIVGGLSSWLGIDWGPIEKWRTAEQLHHIARLLAV